MSFVEPSWATKPAGVVTLLVEKESGPPESINISSKPSFTLGRADTCDLVIPDSAASRSHAAIVHHTDGRAFLIDLKSSHGTWLNGKQLESHKPAWLRNGSVFYCGSPNKRNFTVQCSDSVQATNASESASDEVRASHILIKHRDSRNPSSWKEAHITRSKDEAIHVARMLRDDITSGRKTFGAIAEKESHCSSARRQGDLGSFGPGKMQEAFDSATRALKVGELSQPVESASGVHLILRTA
ncbi:hypothetical protein WJX74_003968 [Apatococcus lobatus]|uniref:Peptidyl-prolyl cis-trans isomerase n=1 Tax=Apatococcus lobatus TaxID=904363 RepID=A0AAW1S604_9CHLO